MSNILKTTTLSTTLQAEIEHWLKKYPPNRRQSALIPALLIAQRQHEGWLPQSVIDAVADYIGISRMIAYEAATFYSMLELKPIGRYKISVCTNVSCMLNGCDRIVQHLKKRLQLEFGETSPEKTFTLKEVECLGACIQAPVMLINEEYHENLTPQKVDDILDQLKKDYNA